MGPLAGLAIQGGMALGKWGYNKLFNKPKAFDRTGYGAALKTRMQSGKYSATATQNILSGVANNTANATNATKTAYQGRLASMGLNNSIAGASKLADIDRTRIDAIGGAAKTISLENEASKADAAMQYAQTKDQYNDASRAANNQNNMDLLGGLANAGVDYLGKKQYQSALSNLNMGDQSSVTGFVAKSGAPDKAADLVKSLATADYYSGRNDAKTNGSLGTMISGAQSTGTQNAVKQFFTDQDPQKLLGSLQSLGLSDKQIEFLVNSMDNPEFLKSIKE